MTVIADSLSDTPTQDPQVSNNQRTAVNNLQMDVTNDVNLGATTWRASQDVTLNTGSLTLATNTQLAAGAAMALTTTRGDMNLGQAQVQSVGNMALDAGANTINISADGGQGLTTSAGSLSVSAGSLNNAGAMQSATGAAFDVGSVNNTGTIANAANTLRITGNALSNEGTISSEVGELTISGNINLGASGVVQTTRSLSVDAGSLTFDAPTARILAATQTSDNSDALNITVASDFTNNAMLYSANCST